jgi:hypothetical protein
MIPRVFCLIFTSVLLSHCADQSEVESMAATEASKPRTMNERFNNRSKEGYYQDGEGNWKTNNNKRSSFESVGRASMAQQQYKGKSYEANRVEKSAWWGNQRYEASRFAGNTSADQYKTAAKGVREDATESGQKSIFSRKSMKTQTLDTQTARENSQARVLDGSPSARETQQRYDEPTIIDWKEQRSLDIKDTKSWLKK